MYGTKSYIVFFSLVNSYFLVLQLSKVQDDNKALERLTKSKEAALLEAEREVQFANVKAAMVDDLLNKNQELTKSNDICQVTGLFLILSVLGEF